MPTSVDFAAGLPHKTLGKILKRALREPFCLLRAPDLTRAMNTSWIRSAVRRLPPIARRDEALAELRRELDELRATNAALKKDRPAHAERTRDAFARIPSFQARVHLERRLRKLGQAIGAPSTSVIRHGKFHVYDLVRSHGIETPAELGRWDDPRDIPWAELPDLVVVKSAYGTNAQGAWPLRRSDDGWCAVGGTESITADDLTSWLTALVEQGTIRAPFVAEEFLDEDGTGRLPTDVKIYAFYGEVPMVVLRRPGRLGEEWAKTLYRAVDEHGVDTVGLETASTVDPTLPSRRGSRRPSTSRSSCPWSCAHRSPASTSTACRTASSSVRSRHDRAVPPGTARSSTACSARPGTVPRHGWPAISPRDAA